MINFVWSSTKLFKLPYEEKDHPIPMYRQEIHIVLSHNQKALILQLMGVTKNLLVLLFIKFSSCFFFVELCTAATDTITFSQPIRDSETIICNSGVFKMGFFNPVNSTNRYLGIWYSFSPSVVVWVANRDKPIKDSSSVTLKISEDGNLVIVSNNGNGVVLWSSNVSYPVKKPYV